MAENNIGKITQIISAVLDIKFPEGQLPEINEAINIATKDGGKLVVEVAQHLGDDTVRCIALGPTDGLVRGMEAVATGAPIKVPVGEVTLGRMFNVLGEPIDEQPAPAAEEYDPIHLLHLKSSLHLLRFLRQVLRSLTFFVHIRRVERLVCSVVLV